MTQKLSLFLMTFMLSSCCTELYFEKDETYWTDVYKPDDFIIFQSQTDRTRFDTIQILSKTDYTPKGECILFVSKYDRESSVIEYRYIHDGYTSEKDLFVQNFKSERGKTIPRLRVFGTEVHRSKLKDTIIETNSTGRISDCHTFNRRNTYNGFTKFKIKTFVWSKNYGLVMYQGINGEKYDFIKKVRH